MSELIKLTITEARDKLAKKEFSVTDLTSSYIKSMEQNRGLNAYITETPEIALKMAADSQSRIDAGKAGILEGIPLGIKDLYCTKGVKTTAGSKILDDFTPPYESTVTQNLWNAGAVMLGKTNMDEFAMGSSNLTSAFGPVKNPWKSKSTDEDLVPGGSSGGSAAAVAADMAMATTASDTGGSIRQPAAFTATVGLKPTYGRCSRYGMVAFASSLDQAGSITKTVRDSAIMLEAMASYDPKEATSANIPVPRFEKALTGNIKGLKVGIPKEFRIEGTPPEILKMWDDGIETLKRLGAEIHDISLPHTKYALPCYYIIAPAEASSNLSRYDGLRYGNRVPGDTLDEMYENTRAAGFGNEVKTRIMIGTYVLSAGYYDAYFIKAQKVRRAITQDFTDAFKTVDVIFTPTAPNGAFSISNPPSDPIKMYLNDVFTVSTSLAGLPGISIPGGLDNDGLPLGLQFIGRAFDEETVLKAADAMEAAIDFNNKVNEMRRA